MKIPFTSIQSGFLLICSGLLSLACMTEAAADAGSAKDLRDGFFLLRDVCHEESQVHLITMVKTTPPKLVDYVNRISKLADESLADVNAMEQHDQALKTDQNPLPAFEQAVRSSIRADKQHNLLFGTEGAHFSRALVLTQLDASNYIANIAKVLAQEDPSPNSAHKLEKMSDRWLAIREEGVRFLSYE